MVKILGCLLIIAASSLVGFILAEDLKLRLKELKELQSAVMQLENEIMFTHTTLPEAFIKISSKCRLSIRKLFKSIGKKLQSNNVDTVYEAFRLSIEELSDDIKLDKNDRDEFLQLGKALGEADIDGHKKIFKLIDNNLRKRIEEAEDLVKKNSKMYKSLGFSFGMVVAILLI